MPANVLTTAICSRFDQCSSAAHAALFVLWLFISYTCLKRGRYFDNVFRGYIGKMLHCAALLHEMIFLTQRPA